MSWKLSSRANSSGRAIVFLICSVIDAVNLAIAKDRKFPEYRWDYCFPGDEVGFKFTVLVGKEKGSKAWMATTVPMKGSSGRFSVDKCMEFLDENGDREGTILVKTDQEPAIEFLVKAVANLYLSKLI